MTRNRKSAWVAALDSIWARVLIPLALLGVNGFAVNVLASQAVRSDKVDLNQVVGSRYFLVYLVTAILLGTYEIFRARRENLANVDFGQRILDSVQTDLAMHSRALIKQGKTEEAFQTVERARRAYEPGSNANEISNIPS